jgi:hypothetical protein
MVHGWRVRYGQEINIPLPKEQIKNNDLWILTADWYPENIKELDISI